jgi:voltage-gated sodium channel
MLRKIAAARYFQNFITIVIVLASVLVGVETYPEMEKQYHRLLHTLDLLIIGMFTLEVVIKIGAEGRHPLRDFQEYPVDGLRFAAHGAVVLHLRDSGCAALRQE